MLDPETDPDAFWERVGTNLKAGKVRLVFISDEIPQKLRRIVEFLNSQMSPAEVLAVEIKQYLGEDLQTLVPRQVGQTAEAQMRKGRPEGRHWDELSFLGEVERVFGQQAAEVARKIMDWARSNLPRYTFGKGSIEGIFIPVLDHQGRFYKPLWITTTRGVEFPFHTIRHTPPFDDEAKRVELVRRLNAIPGVQIPEEAAVNSRPSVPLATFAPPEALATLLASLEWTLTEIRGGSK